MEKLEGEDYCIHPKESMTVDLFNTGERCTIAFDVDGTLITEDGYDRPRRDIIAMLHLFCELGHDVVVWSGGGTDYALAVCRRLGIDHLVRIIPKRNYEQNPQEPMPDIAFDDCETSLAKVNVRVKSRTW
jgi:predicted HAD superfamily phosphohydrolase YqeG